MRAIYGINPIRELLLSGAQKAQRILLSTRKNRQTDELVRMARANNVRVDIAPDAELERLCNSDRHQGAVAIIGGSFEYRGIDDIISAWKGSGQKALILLVDSIQDPQNLGALIRSAVAAGAHGIIIPKDRACEITPVVIKASAGLAEEALIARETNLVRSIEELKANNIWIAGLEAGAKESVFEADLNTDLGLVVGSEGKGIRRLVQEHCDFLVSIPMPGRINSLNAAQAGTVALFEAVRQRGQKAPTKR